MATEEWDFDDEDFGKGHAIVTDTTTDGQCADFCVSSEGGSEVEIRRVFAERILILHRQIESLNAQTYNSGNSALLAKCSGLRVRDLPDLPADEEYATVLRALSESALDGCVYLGDKLEGVIAAVKVLRACPELATFLTM
jgi:hypothetical protein